MAHPIYQLPLAQNWSCTASGSCCKDYRVHISEEERQRIDSQGWDRDKDLGGLAPYVRHGLLWNRHYQLNQRSDGSCVFLSEQGRCRIHERFGFETKPLPCRLFPFVLVPVADGWRVGVRYACPSAAANKGRPLPEHQPELAEFAAQLARREGLQAQPDGSLASPPRLQMGQRVEWPDLLSITDVLLQILRNRRDPMERRLRKCLMLAAEMRKANLEPIKGGRLGELLGLLRLTVDSDTPPNLMTLPRPSWVGRILFRQALALFTRKDLGPNRGPAARNRFTLFRTALSFARGRGRVPRLHRGLPETTFEAVEAPRGPLPDAAEQVLERYYTMKVGSLQFCGARSFGLPFWAGFELLALTFPVILWVARTFSTGSREEAVMRALTIVDDHIGYNRVLASLRQRLSIQILARTDQLARLVAWYSR